MTQKHESLPKTPAEALAGKGLASPLCSPLLALKMCILGIEEAVEKGATIHDAKRWTLDYGKRAGLKIEQIEAVFHTAPANLIFEANDQAQTSPNHTEK